MVKRIAGRYRPRGEPPGKTLSTCGECRGWYAFGGKRVFDLIVATPIALASLPVQAVLAVVVRLRLGSPVLFRQTRPGLEGQPFVMVKFRTMTSARDAHGALLPDADRLTPLGRFLRSTSLDELPELYNVVRGDMSLVGPRPLLMEYLDRYTEDQSRRHEVRPGITGLAQVRGRNNATWEAKFASDVEYVDNMSIALDVRILLRTVQQVLLRRDIAADGHVTAPKYDPSVTAD